ncbi:MAG: tRNA-intron lyase [Candidatus Nanoarchaeia archaeon]|nr:tRNA-intron lyase [Candidatus Nanoarchaeia archaeon]
MTAELINDLVIINDERIANSLHSKGFIGTLEKAKLELSGIEALYLANKEKIIITKSGKELTEQDLLKFFSKKDKRFILKYKVFSDLRNSGYVVKTALKYGFDFRVYDKGVSPGEDHAIWLVYCSNQNDSLKIIDYSKLIRVCHSVKKKMLLGIVDDEGDVTYWESAWTKMK